MKNNQKECCYGFGLWAIGDACPMGPMDAKDGMPTIACPECGSNANPVRPISKIKISKRKLKKAAKVSKSSRKVSSKTMQEEITI